VIFERIEWEEHNLAHATKRLTVAEIEQAILNADEWFRHRKRADRRVFMSTTDGGKSVVVIVQVVRDGVRPITGWEVQA
jgi:hypothetical protein